MEVQKLLARVLLSLSSSTASGGQAAHRLDIIRNTVTNVLELMTGGDTTNCTRGNTCA